MNFFFRILKKIKKMPLQAHCCVLCILISKYNLNFNNAIQKRFTSKLTVIHHFEVSSTKKQHANYYRNRLYLIVVGREGVYFCTCSVVQT